VHIQGQFSKIYKFYAAENTRDKDPAPLRLSARAGEGARTLMPSEMLVEKVPRAWGIVR